MGVESAAEVGSIKAAGKAIRPPLALSYRAAVPRPNV